MGKPYSEEISRLSASYEWAQSVDVGKLADFVRRISGNTLISIGSGGSYSAAVFQALLHEQATGLLSAAITPYQARSRNVALASSAVSLLSAEGKNKDILGALRVAVNCEPENVFALALRTDAPLTVAANASMCATSASYDMPWGKDGYLATNSLLATCVLLYRSYQCAYPALFEELPSALDDLVNHCVPSYEERLRRYISGISTARNSFLVIYGENGRVAAVDLESKLVEAGLGTAILADFRNFAHGRHLWAERYKSTAAAVLLFSDDDVSSHDDICRLLPSEIPRLSIPLNASAGPASIAGIWCVLKFIESLGALHGVDPGNPVVPDFGKALYSSDVFSVAPDTGRIASTALAIARKSAARRPCDADKPWAQHFSVEYGRFLAELGNARFSGVVLDYDATLCLPEERFGALLGSISAELQRLAAAGALIGIATGRGKSAVRALRDALPEKLHPQVWVGLYNGARIVRLDHGCASCAPIDAVLQAFHDELTTDPYFSNLLELELRPEQITATVVDSVHAENAWRAICGILQEDRFASLKAVRSTHSWDIVRRSTSKRALVAHLAALPQRFSSNAFLCVGDRGLWPGNDFELLAGGYCLGVDEVAPIGKSAWNIAPPGVKGVAATLYYLRRLVATDEGFCFMTVQE